MAILTRESVAKPTLAKATVHVEWLGGDVVLRALTLSEHLSLSSSRTVDLTPVAAALAVAVLGADNKPLFTSEEWNVLGGQRLDSVVELFNSVQRLTKTGSASPPEGDGSSGEAEEHALHASIAKN